ncbi:winged helix-turn-helix transcriptional regulator, partial [Streptomyces specialis]|uniref:winged helix-turn-helix transcriptional regulator n=1 Tax=Streptomyces specialis TaxID=498367 RepID=UPI000AB1B4E6
MTGGTRTAGDPRDVFAADCPARTALDHVASRWGVLILAALRRGPQRFSQVRDRVGGISEKMLAQNLRILAHDGLVTRHVEPAMPVRVPYALTPLGEKLAAPLQTLLDVIAARTPDIMAARARRTPPDTPAPPVRAARVPAGRIPVMLACLLARMPMHVYLRGDLPAAPGWPAGCGGGGGARRGGGGGRRRRGGGPY